MRELIDFAKMAIEFAWLAFVFVCLLACTAVVVRLAQWLISGKWYRP